MTDNMNSKKIIVCIAPSESDRMKRMQQEIVKMGFAKIPSDAGKLIRSSPHDFSNDDYFIFASSYNFRESPLTTRTLVERALHGDAVIIGTKKLPPELELFCEIIR